MINDRQNIETLIQVQDLLPSFCSGTASIEDLHQAAVLAEQLIQEALGTDARLPVDIRKVAEYVGIEPMDDDLTGLGGQVYRYGQIQIIQTSFTKQRARIIRVERSLSKPAKRHVIACGAAYGILHYGDDTFEKDILPLAKAPAGKEFSAVNLFALFLLMPLGYVLREYVSEKKISQTSSEWTAYLANRYGIPECYAASGYQMVLAVL